MEQNTHTEIPDTEEAWENGDLGRNMQYAQIIQTDGAAIDAALNLKMISIRLEQSVINDFKTIAEFNGLGYQTLMRQILKRWIVSEKKLIARDMIRRRKEEIERAEAAAEDTSEGCSERKAA